MKTKISIFIILLSISTMFGQRPTRFDGGIKLTNAVEETDFSTYDRIPLMRPNGKINNFIHSDSIVLEGRLDNYLLKQGQDIGESPFNLISDGIAFNSSENISLNATSIFFNGESEFSTEVKFNDIPIYSGTYNFSDFDSDEFITQQYLVDYIDGSTNSITESEVSLEKEYQNIKKVSTAFISVGQLHIEHYSDGYIYAYNYDNDLDSNSNIFDLNVGDNLYVQGLDGEIASITITDYVYSDSSLLEFELGALDSGDYLDSVGDVINYTDTNFSDSTGVTKFNVFLYSDIESTALNVADALSYLDVLESKLGYNFENGIVENNGIVKQGGEVLNDIELDLSEGVGYKLTTDDQYGNNIFTHINNSNVFQIQKTQLNGNTNTTNSFSTFASGYGYLGGQVYNGDAILGTSYGSIIEATVPSISIKKFNTPTGQSNSLILTDSDVSLNYRDIEIVLTDNLATISTEITQITDPKSVTTKEYVDKKTELTIPPSSSTDTGVLGEVRFTSTGIYICVATNTWIKTQTDTTF